MAFVIIALLNVSHLCKENCEQSEWVVVSICKRHLARTLLVYGYDDLL